MEGWTRKNGHVQTDLSQQEAAVIRGLVGQIKDMLTARAEEAPSPVLVHQALDGSPGLTRVRTFGPRVGVQVRLDRTEAAREAARETGRAPRRLVYDDGWSARYPAVEVYAVPGAREAGLSPTAPVVVGGPEDLLGLLGAWNQRLAAEQAADALEHHDTSAACTFPPRGGCGQPPIRCAGDRQRPSARASGVRARAVRLDRP